MTREEALEAAKELGDELRSTRENNNLSLMEISETLGIRSYLLNDMEKGLLKHLRLGDCLAYAKYLGVDLERMKRVREDLISQSVNEVQELDVNKVRLTIGVAVLVVVGIISTVCLVTCNGKKNEELPVVIETQTTQASTDNKFNTIEITEEPVVEVTNKDTSSLVVEENNTNTPVQVSEEVILQQADDLGIVVEDTSPTLVEVSESANNAEIKTPAKDEIVTGVVIESQDKVDVQPKVEVKTEHVQAPKTEPKKEQVQAPKTESKKENVKPNNNKKPAQNSVQHTANKPQTTSNLRAGQIISLSEEQKQQNAKKTQDSNKQQVVNQVKPNDKKEKTPSTTTNRTSTQKPLQYGEVRSLAEEMGITPKATTEAQPAKSSATSKDNNQINEAEIKRRADMVEIKEVLGN